MDSTFAQFMQAQELESRGDAEAAREAYAQLVATAKGARRYDESTDDPSNAVEEEPPAALLVSVSLNTIGGFHLDAGRLDDASAAFVESLDVWPHNAMALVNLGDLEREHGSFAGALTLYERAAALPPCGEADDESDDESE